MKGKPRIATVVGARPQFVKAATVSRALTSIPRLDEVLIHTGQHYDDRMSQIFFDELEIPEPAHNLNVGSGSHGYQTGAMLEKIEQILLADKINMVLVYGDTNSTLAGALAAVKLHIPIAHVEAGLRSYNRRMPEEINRVLTDHAADVLFAPTDTAVSNLIKEGIPRSAIWLVGDVMYDAALYYADKAEANSRIMDKLGVMPKEYVLATLHRAENTDEPKRLRTILDGLTRIAQDTAVVLPLHPRTKVALKAIDVNYEQNASITFIKPVGYLDMIMLEKNASVIVTDSGGIQKEAFFHGVPCVTLRDETEWTELLELEWNRLVSPLTERAIMRCYEEALSKPIGKHGKPYGNGDSSKRIARVLEEMLR